MGEHYNHFTLEERCRLRGLLEQGLGPAAIARRLGRHRSTINREIKRNRCVVDGYRPDSADKRAWARKLRGSRIGRSIPLRTYVGDRLAMGWSPEQIVGRMELEGSEHRTSVESIYRYVWSLEGRKAGLPRLLRQRKRKRGRGRRRGTRLPIPDRVPIHERPEEANLRKEIGHWEGDVMHFRKGGQALLTLEDRCCRLTLARRLLSMEADGCARAIVAELGPLPPPARRTLTCDNGSEFAAHGRVTAWTEVAAYFCDPGCPGQRGSIENTHGCLRVSLPRGTNLAEISDAEIAKRMHALNATPRKCLGWRTPLEAFNRGLAAELRRGFPVALGT
jgi:transposase, IS30 family